MAPEEYSNWLRPTPQGLYCVPGGFHLDPAAPVPRAVISHGHGDHARPGHRRVLATAETIAIMKVRFGDEAGAEMQGLAYGEAIRIGDVTLRLVPAGHVLGSAQIVLEHGGRRAVFSGDYKRRPDPTCAPFEAVSCDLFITEATFGLPVFRHPPDAHEIERLLRSLADFPDRTHLVGAYALGKCQRLIALLRRDGYDRPIYLHGALRSLCDLYGQLGVRLGDLRSIDGAAKADLRGALVLAPPAALADRWTRRLPDPLAGLASGWMRVRQRARQRGVELPLVISDHADWDELTATMVEVGAEEVWITHGLEDGLAHHARGMGLRAREMTLAGFAEDSP